MEGVILTERDERIQRARDGDREARAALVEEYYPRIHALARKLTRDDEVAREVTQETFLRAFARFEQFGEEHSLAAWLFRIATNHIRDLFRKQSRWETTDEEPAVFSTVESILQRSEDLHRVRKALDALAPESRTAMILHLQEGLPIEEIAFAMGRTANSVRMLIYRGLRKVRERVRGER